MERKIAKTLFEVSADIHVFHVVKESEAKLDVHPYEVYWTNTRTHQTYGPFINVYSAMGHLGMGSKEEFRANPVPFYQPQGIVINVDFAKKQRILN